MAVEEEKKAEELSELEEKKQKRYFSNSEVLTLLSCFVIGIFLLIYGLVLIIKQSNPLLGIILIILGASLLVFTVILILLRVQAIKKGKDLRTVESLATRRQETLRMIIRRYNKIFIDEMTTLLDFKDRTELQKWLLSLPPELDFYLEGDQVIIPREQLQSGTTEAEEAIAALLQSFEEFEKKGEGKV